jgi:hypothetical protein
MVRKKTVRLVGALCALGTSAWGFAAVLEGCATAGDGDDGVEDTGSGNDATTNDGGCTGSQTSCNGSCTNTQTDPKNCGACGHPCDDASVCSQGQCAASCSGATTKCGQACVNEQTDPQHCGGCDASCASGDFCDAGACIPSCTAQQELCSDGGLFCANIQTDNGNCGGCNIACTNGWTCQQGRCLPNCMMPQTLCDIDGSADGGPPYCSDLQTDNGNCGMCNNVCPTTQYCDGGACVNQPINTSTCKTVNGLTWCYHPGTCGEACNTVCNYFSKTPVSNQTAWTDAQATASECQAIATAFNNTSTPSLASYTYACTEVNGSSDDAGTLTGQFYCSNYAMCPANHLTNMDGLGNACGTAAWISLCPCQ